MIVDKAYKLEYLENTGSPEMNVDGATTPQTFKYDIPAGEEWYFSCTSLFILDTGAMAHTGFGSIAALTNGFDFIVKKNGTDFKIKSIKTNIDLLFAFPRNKMSGSTATGFLNESDYFFGSRNFEDENGVVRLRGDDGDKIKIVIRDDLTAIDCLRASVTLWKPII